MSATAATIGIGIAATSNTSARDLYDSPEREEWCVATGLPQGRYMSAAFEMPTREERTRQDFQLDRAYQ
jgi:hypothetical protein